ncbi:hypothetical protein Tco_1342665 [Tanacetum coccineum]
MEPTGFEIDMHFLRGSRSLLELISQKGEECMDRGKVIVFIYQGKLVHGSRESRSLHLSGEAYAYLSPDLGFYSWYQSLVALDLGSQGFCQETTHFQQDEFDVTCDHSMEPTGFEIDMHFLRGSRSLLELISQKGEECMDRGEVVVFIYLSFRGSLYVVPTGRVIATVSIKVPTGRYIVPAGYIISPGTDIAKITRKRSKSGKLEHGNGKSAQEPEISSKRSTKSPLVNS